MISALLARHSISAADLRRATAQQGRRAGQPLSAAAMSDLINKEVWPRETPREALRQQIEAYLTGRGVSREELEGLWPADAPAGHGDTKHPGAKSGEKPQAKTMLPQAQTLTQLARRKFGLKFNPFEGLPQAAEDYYLTDAMRSAYEAINEAAYLRVLRAIVGESGSGKTTLKRLFRLNEGRAVNLIEVLVTTMSDSDKRGGRVMPSTQIHTTIIRHLAGENARVPADSHDRQARCRQLLQAAAEGGKPTLLLIDEGHDLRADTLAHLKRFHELAEGALGIVVIGQPGLAAKLTPRLAPDIKEAGQRFPIEYLPPLEPDEIAGYLDKRLFRAGSTFGAVFDADAPAALAAHLTRREQHGRGAATAVSEAFPLAIGNLAAAAINRCAALGFERVNAEIVSAAAREA